MTPAAPKPFWAKRFLAFSLVEVVLAIGIFAVAVVSVIGLLGPINRSVANVRDTDDASRVIGMIQNELERVGIVAASGLIGQIRYASRLGDQFGDDVLTTPWNADINGDGSPDVPDLNGDGSVDTFEINAQKHFEVSFARPNPSIPFDSATASFLVINVTLRWPAYTSQPQSDADASKNKLVGDALDQQSILVVPMVVRR
jgi:type II secretory pathway pseudopilin PulG